MSEELENPADHFVDKFLVLDLIQDMTITDDHNRNKKISLTKEDLYGVCPVFDTEEAATKYIGDRRIVYVKVKMPKQEEE